MIIASGKPGGDGNRPQDLDGRIDQLPHQRHPPDQHAQRQRDDQRQREAAIDPAHRCEEMDVQRPAIGIVIDAAEGEVLQFEPDVMRRRDQACRPVHSGEMPEREQQERKSDRQQDRPQPRPSAFANSPAGGQRGDGPRFCRGCRGFRLRGECAHSAYVGFTASTKLVSMKVAKSGICLICFSASMCSA